MNETFGKLYELNINTGAIRQWVANQDIYDNYFCVVDLHAITVPQDPKKLEQETLQAAAMYIASGYNINRYNIILYNIIYIILYCII